MEKTANYSKVPIIYNENQKNNTKLGDNLRAKIEIDSVLRHCQNYQKYHNRRLHTYVFVTNFF